MNTLLALHHYSNYNAISNREDLDFSLIFDVEPHKKLRRIAQRKEAFPHMALLLDCSGSMHDTDQHGSRYIDQMIKCATSLIDDLNDKDQVSLAFFASTVSEVQSFKGHERDQLRAAIERGVDHYGNTNMAAGLERMIQVLCSDSSRPRNILPVAPVTTTRLMITPHFNEIFNEIDCVPQDEFEDTIIRLSSPVHTTFLISIRRFLSALSYKLLFALSYKLSASSYKSTSALCRK